MYQNLHFFRELKYSRRFWDAAMAEFWDVASGPAGSAAAGIALEMETRRAGSSRLRTPGHQLTTSRRYRRRRRRSGPETDRRSIARRSTRGHAGSGGYRTGNTKAPTHLPAQGNGAKQCSIRSPSQTGRLNSEPDLDVCIYVNINLMFQ